MAALPKQPVSVFFGATNQDTSAKGVKLGDLIEAKNVQQVKGGEFSKRTGFTESTQTYGGDTVVPDSIVSPDGMQRIIRDRNTDDVYVTGAALGTNVGVGESPRIFPNWATRFPALASGENVAPMAKRAGEYLVWLVDDETFGIGRVNSVASLASGSPDDQLSLVQSLRVSAPATAGDSTVRSFAVIDDAHFDADHIWIFFVVRSTSAYSVPGAIYALKIDHDLTGTVSRVTTYGDDVNRKHCLTSISAGLVDTAAGTKLFLCACGSQITNSAEIPNDPFRWKGGEPNVGTTYCLHMFVSSVGQADTLGVVTHTMSVGKQTASGCCLLSVGGQFQGSAASVYYTFVGSDATSSGHDNQGGYLVQVTTATLAVAAHYFYQAVDVTPTNPPVPPPSDFKSGMYGEGWWYLGQTTGKESANTVDICFTLNHYYRRDYGSTSLGDSDFRCLNPDYQTTSLIKWDRSAHTFSVSWTARGSWLAHGWVNVRRDLANVGSPYVITGYEDRDALQSCYHLRKWDTGYIVAQFASGEAAHSGGCATRDSQVFAHATDLNQAMLAGANPYAADTTHFTVLLGLQSANIVGAVDVARVILESWDADDSRTLRLQNPSVFRAFALSPGPIPTVVNGWQRLREAGPLLFPSSIDGFYGSGAT